MLMRRLALLLCLLAPLACPARDTVLRPGNVAIVINEADANSREIGDYLREARQIPRRNVVKVSIPDSPHTLSAEQFDALKRSIDAQLHPDTEVVVLVWTAPYAVECNSITSALTLGFDAGQCTNTCAPGKPSRYFDSRVQRPYAELGMRLSMLLPTTDVKLARALIDRGRLPWFAASEANAHRHLIVAMAG